MSGALRVSGGMGGCTARENTMTRIGPDGAFYTSKQGISSAEGDGGVLRIARGRR